MAKTATTTKPINTIGDIRSILISMSREERLALMQEAAEAEVQPLRDELALAEVQLAAAQGLVKDLKEQIRQAQREAGVALAPSVPRAPLITADKLTKEMVTETLKRFAGDRGLSKNTIKRALGIAHQDKLGSAKLEDFLQDSATKLTSGQGALYALK